MQTLDLNYKKL